MQAAGQGMAIGMKFWGRGLSGRHRFGGGGGWRSALLSLPAAAWRSRRCAGQAMGQAAVVPSAATRRQRTTRIVGTGWLGRTLGLKDEWGIKLGGMWLADTNVLVAGGAPARRLDQQPGAVPRPQYRCRKAGWLAGRIVRLPVPAVQRRRDQRAGGQHRRLQQHRQPAAAQPHRAARGLVPAGDGEGRAVDADRPKHAVLRFRQRLCAPSRSPIRTRTFRP